jgi:GT2 family glycosyltransferase
MVMTLCADARLIRNKSNQGWSVGNNLGIVKAKEIDAKYIVLVNNDIRVDPRWLGIAVKVAESDPRIGVIGFKILEPELGNPDRDASFEIAKASWTNLELSYPKYVGGMAMFVRAEVFDRIGLIDEGFFAYGEENDFQIRARKAGYSIVATNVPVWHHGQGSFGRIPTRAALLQTRNNIQLLIKHASIQQIMQAGATHLRLRCLPSGMSQASCNKSPVERRLRPSNFFVNLTILLYAVVWNLLRLPVTLRKRYKDNQRAGNANLLWGERLTERYHNGSHS